MRNELVLGFSEDSLPFGSHACFYYSDEASLKATLAFLRTGLDAPGDFCVIFADVSRHEGLVEWLQDGYDGDVRELLAAGKLVLVGGAPRVEPLVAGIKDALDGAIAQGYEAIRFLGFIAWGQAGWPDDVSLLEFESAVNKVVTSYPAVIICTYGVPRLKGQTLLYGGLETHPIIFLNDLTVQGNPFYVRPETYDAARRIGD